MRAGNGMLHYTAGAYTHLAEQMHTLATNNATTYKTSKHEEAALWLLRNAQQALPVLVENKKSPQTSSL
jgi:dsDNA-binding SOS-regulon protein